MKSGTGKKAPQQQMGHGQTALGSTAAHEVGNGTEVFATASLLHDFSDAGDVTMAGTTLTQSSFGTWGEVVGGVIFQASDSTAHYPLRAFPNSTEMMV